jgi:hypothetical protein
LRSIRIKGGLEPNGDENFAQIGKAEWRREAGETVEAFRERMTEVARAQGQAFVAFGGLPPMRTGEDSP